jgi:hypothetical protein
MIENEGPVTGPHTPLSCVRQDMDSVSTREN